MKSGRPVERFYFEPVKGVKIAKIFCKYGRLKKAHAGRRGSFLKGVTYARAHIPVWGIWRNLTKLEEGKTKRGKETQNIKESHC